MPKQVVKTKFSKNLKNLFDCLNWLLHTKYHDYLMFPWVYVYVYVCVVKRVVKSKFSKKFIKTLHGGWIYLCVPNIIIAYLLRSNCWRHIFFSFSFKVILGYFFDLFSPGADEKIKIKKTKNNPSWEYKFRLMYQNFWLLEVSLSIYHWWRVIRHFRPILTYLCP